MILFRKKEGKKEQSNKINQNNIYNTIKCHSIYIKAFQLHKTCQIPLHKANAINTSILQERTTWCFKPSLKRMKAAELQK